MSKKRKGNMCILQGCLKVVTYTTDLQNDAIHIDRLQ